VFNKIKVQSYPHLCISDQEEIFERFNILSNTFCSNDLSLIKDQDILDYADILSNVELLSNFYVLENGKIDFERIFQVSQTLSLIQGDLHTSFCLKLKEKFVKVAQH